MASSGPDAHGARRPGWARLRWKSFAAICWALALASLTGSSGAADTLPPASIHSTDPLGGARAAIAGQQWEQALAELRKLQADGNADWHNLMGYALRKRAVPDLTAAQHHYDTALRIEPDHRAALEYAGELALLKGELARAERHLARLVRLCPNGCEERADLERAVTRFRAEGHLLRP